MEQDDNNEYEKLNIDKIPRCPKCNLISSLKFYYKEGKPAIKYACENNHTGNLYLDEYINKYNTYSLLKQKCEECNKNQSEVKDDFSYCCKCDKFLCHSCILNHPNNGKHNTFNFTRYDSICKIHSNFFNYYCTKCKKNLCVYCYNQHKDHELLNLSEFNYTEESKKNLEKEIKNIEKKILDIDKIKDEIVSEIDKLKKSNELEMKFFKILVNAYEYEESQNNVNYNVIKNIKNFEEILKKSEKYEKIYKEGKKYISFLQNILQTFGQTNSLKNNFLTIKNHSTSICHLSQLNDGRLISSSNDSTLNIYQKDTFELQLSIKEHSSGVSFFTQLHNDKIISCSWDHTMNIIKLLDENKYILEQKLTGHNHYVCNAIEIKENEIISVSYDKTMKIWELGNNKFECTKTINFQNSENYCNILKINENEFVTSSYGDKCISFWSSNDYSNIAKIENIETDWNFRRLCIIKDGLLCVGGSNSKGFYLINILNHQLIKNIIGPKDIYSIYECIDGLFLCAIQNENGDYSIVKYKYENDDMKKIVEKEKAHKYEIRTCFELDDGTIASGGNDNLIKLWRN